MQIPHSSFRVASTVFFAGKQFLPVFKLIPVCASAMVLASVPKSAQAADSQPLRVGAHQMSVNIMKEEMPNLPAFPKLTPKAGVVRGYIKDTNGKPLAGALIGVRATATGGLYSGASATSDARGYYEVKVPWGSVHFYCASYTTNYGGGRAALSLHPTDGQSGTFPSGPGLVRNWVLLPYGIADRNTLSEKPHFSTNFYGGAVNIDYHTTDRPPTFADDDYLPEGSQIDLSFTPVGKLLDGSQGRSFNIIREVGNSSWENFNVNNIPVGIYRVQAQLSYQGKTWPLHWEEIGPKSSMSFGLEPKSGSDQPTLTLRPSSASNEKTLPQYGSWDAVSLRLKK